VNRGDGTTGGADDGADFDLEVIDLEPTDAAKPRHDPATGVGRRRGPVVIAIVVVVALVGSAIVSRSHRSGTSTATTRAAQGGTGLNGRPLFPFRVGAQILTGGLTGMLLVDTDTGRVTTPRITGLPAGPVTIVAHSGDTVAVRVDAHLYWFSMVRRFAQSVDGDTAFPAARQGYLWLAGQRFATEVPGATVPVATNGPAIGATRAGLLVVTKAGVLLQPTAGNGTGAARLLLRAPATVIGVHPDRVAWLANDCGVLRCPVHVTEVATDTSSSWLQLVGHPSPLVLAGSSARFSPDGVYLAIVVPDASVTIAETLVVADLRTRVSNVTYVRGRFDEPARPGSVDATGNTVDWTLDGRFLLLAPASGTGPLGLVDPGTPRVVASRGSMGVIATAAAIGISSAGPLDYPRRGSPGPIDTGGPTPLDRPGLSLVGADDRQVDVLDLGSNRLTAYPVGGVVPNPAGPDSIARVTGGWLVVRGATVELLTDAAGTATNGGLIGAGSLVFSSNHGRDAWIAIVTGGSLRVEPYDPATDTIGPVTTVVGTPVGAVDAGLLVSVDAPFQGTEFKVIDRSGRLQHGPVIDSAAIDVLDAAGTHVAFIGAGGLYVLDLASRTDQLIATDATGAALSRDGTALAWIEQVPGPGPTHVNAMRVDGATVADLGGPADRVLVADDGTVLFTNGVDVRRGRVDADGSTPVYGLAPGPAVTLALG
jgi:hypothetical protein